MVSGGDGVWKSPALVASYLQGVRAAVPLATEQIEAMMRLVVAGKGPVTSFLDLGCGDGILAAALLEQDPGSKGVLLDFSEPMIQSARIKLQNYRENLVFKLSTMETAAGFSLQPQRNRSMSWYQDFRSIINQMSGSDSCMLRSMTC